MRPMKSRSGSLPCCMATVIRALWLRSFVDVKKGFHGNGYQRSDVGFSRMNKWPCRSQTSKPHPLGAVIIGSQARYDKPEFVASFHDRTPFFEDGICSDQESTEEPEGDAQMKREGKLELVHGSGNVFRDFGRSNADAEQFKVILATEIIKALDRE